MIVNYDCNYDCNCYYTDENNNKKILFKFRKNVH